jgi:hypothetical protein
MNTRDSREAAIVATLLPATTPPLCAGKATRRVWHWSSTTIFDSRAMTAPEVLR